MARASGRFKKARIEGLGDVADAPVGSPSRMAKAASSGSAEMAATINTVAVQPMRSYRIRLIVPPTTTPSATAPPWIALPMPRSCSGRYLVA
jgi:hypothetical protein